MQSGNSEITPASTLTKQIITIEYTKTTDTAATTPKIPFEPLTEYSTEEKMVGYWIDGKPLYRKVWNVVLTDMNETINHGILNLEQCTKLFAVTAPNEQGIMRPIPSAYYLVNNTGGGWNVDIYIDNAVICIQPGESFLTNYGNKNVQIIAEYTKTT